MIAKLTGILDFLGEDGAVIDVAGVGYQVGLLFRPHPRRAGTAG